MFYVFLLAVGKQKCTALVVIFLFTKIEINQERLKETFLECESSVLSSVTSKCFGVLLCVSCGF